MTTNTMTTTRNSIFIIVQETCQTSAVKRALRREGEPEEDGHDFNWMAGAIERATPRTIATL